MWIFDENFKLRISNGRDEMFLGKGVREFLENSGNLMMENGKAFYFEQFTDQQHQVFVQSITPEVWITLHDPPLEQTTIHFDPLDMTNKFTKFQKHSFHVDSFHHNSLDCLQPIMSRFDKTYSFSNCSTRRNSSPTPPAITISSSDSEDEAEQQQQHNRSSEGPEPRPYAPILTSFPAEQVEIIRLDQVANFKKQHRLAEIERQIQLMQQAKAQIENEEEDEKQIQALRKQSEKTKKERKQKESEERQAKSEARRAEAEMKAKEEAKKQKEEWKRALRRPAATPEEKARKEAENEIRKEAETEARKELEEEARKEAEKKARKEAEEAKEKSQKEAEEAKEKTQKEAEEAKAQKEREEKVKREEEEKRKKEKEAKTKPKKKAEKEENDTIIARGIKKRRLTEAEKEERSQKDAEEKARREITDIVKEVEEEAKQRQIRNKIEELTAKLAGKPREEMGEEEAKELGKEKERFENPPEPPRERRPFYSSAVARFECQSELDSASKPRGREERGDRERNLGMSGKRLFTNMLKSAVGTVNDRPCIPPEGLNREMLKRRPTPAPVPQFTTRSAERSPVRKTYAPFRKGMPLERAEEAIYKIRKSLLQAADALSELADELFPHGEAREKDEGKEDEEAQWGGPGPSHSFM